MTDFVRQQRRLFPKSGFVALAVTLLIGTASAQIAVGNQLQPNTAPPAESSADSEIVFRLDTSASYFEVTPHEYGPPDYVRRRENVSPSIPVYMPVKSPLRQSGMVLANGQGGANTKLRLGGDARLNSTFDFEPIGSNADFVTATIPVPQQSGQNSDFTARASRLQLKTQTNSQVGPITGFVQLDFLDGKTQGEFGSFRPRMRLFYFDVGYFRFGQDASVFMDYDAFPHVIENEGPSGMILMRQSVMRMTLPLAARWNVALAAEQPYSDIDIPTDVAGDPIGNRIQDVPDLTMHLRYDSYHGHLQLSSLLRQLTYQQPAGDSLRDIGYGINVTGDLHLVALLYGGSPQPDCQPAPYEKNRFVWQYATGYGISRYIQDANGLGLDAALDSGGNFDALFAQAWHVGYEHWWTDRWTSTFAYSHNRNAGTDLLPSDTYVGAKYLAANLIWNFTESAWIGFEFLWGERQDFDGQSATARRIQFGAQYNF